MSTQTVLVVEDEPYLRQMVAELLRGEGYRVEEAADGAEALEVVERFHVAPNTLGLVVLDLMLPGVSGLEVLQRLPALGFRVPVLATSVSDQALAAAVAAGAERVLPKPFDPVALLEIVGRSCSARAAAVRGLAGVPFRRGVRRGGAFRPSRRVAARRPLRCRLTPRRLVERALVRLDRTARALEFELSRLETLFQDRRWLRGLD